MLFARFHARFQWVTPLHVVRIAKVYLSPTLVFHKSSGKPMETFAYIESATAHDEPTPEPPPRSNFTSVGTTLQDLGLIVPNAAWLGIATTLLSASILVHAPLADAFPATVAASRGVNVRSGPGTSFPIVGGLSNGTQINVSSSSNGWYQIGSNRWISSTYTSSSTTSTSSNTATSGSGGTPISGSVRTSTAVNIRSGPGTSFGIIDGLPAGSNVQVVSLSRGFYQLANGGWISSGYASRPTASTATATTTATTTVTTTAASTSGSGGTPVSGSVRTSTAVNIRSGPSTSFGIIGGLPAGSTAQVISLSRGFYQLANGGWVSSRYASIQNGNTSTTSGGGGPEGTPISGSVRTSTALNIRSGPGTSFPIVGGLPAGSTVQVTSLSRGFYRLSTGGWISSGYTSRPSAGTGGGGVPSGTAVSGSVRTSSEVNIRSGPGTSFGIIGGLPAGTTVQVTSLSNGFYRLFSGGWISSRYTSRPTTNPGGGGGIPAGTPVSGSVRTSTALNIRSGPGTSFSIIGGLPAGATVQITSLSNGFYRLSSGSWISSGYTSRPTTAAGSGGTPIRTAAAVGTPVSGNVRTSIPLNVRSGPGAGFGVIGRLPAGSILQVSSLARGFYQLPSGGWISSAYASPTNASTAVASTGTSTVTAGGGGTPTTILAAAPAGTAVSGSVRTSSAVNIRSGPGTSFGVIGSLPEGVNVQVVSLSNGFYQLSSGGWISSAYTSRPGTNTGGGGTGTPISGSVTTTSALNIRSGPGTSFAVIGELTSGSTVQVVEQANGFYRLASGGWIASAYTTRPSSRNSGGGGAPVTVVQETILPEPTTTQVATPSETVAQVETNGSDLRIRSSPGGSVIGSVPNGSSVRLAGRSSGRYTELADGGWVSSAWLVY